MYPGATNWGHREYCAQTFFQLMQENTEQRDGFLLGKNWSQDLKKGFMWKVLVKAHNEFAFSFVSHPNTGDYAIWLTPEEHEAFEKGVFEYDLENNMQLGM